MMSFFSAKKVYCKKLIGKRRTKNQFIIGNNKIPAYEKKVKLERGHNKLKVGRHSSSPTPYVVGG